MELSIIIVVWNTRELVLACLDSLRQHPPSCPWEVLVVDNASRDGSYQAIVERFPADRHPWLVPIQSGSNLGFGRGVNLAVPRARGRFLLLLNPDTRVEAGTIDAALARMAQEPGIGVLGVKQRYDDGRVQPSVGNVPSLTAVVAQGLACALARAGKDQAAQRVLRLLGVPLMPVRELARLFDEDREQEVGWVMGSFLLARRELAVGGRLFDERYFMYAEDMDLCVGAARQGWRVVYHPAAAIVHHGGASTKEASAEADAARFVSTVKFYEKYYGSVQAWAYRLAIGLWTVVQLVATFFAGHEPARAAGARRRLRLRIGALVKARYLIGR